MECSQALEQLKRDLANLPFVFHNARIPEAVAIEVFAAGAVGLGDVHSELADDFLATYHVYGLVIFVLGP